MEVRKKLIGDTGDTLITPYRVSEMCVYVCVCVCTCVCAKMGPAAATTLFRVRPATGDILVIGQ